MRNVFLGVLGGLKRNFKWQIYIWQGLSNTDTAYKIIAITQFLKFHYCKISVLRNIENSVVNRNI